MLPLLSLIVRHPFKFLHLLFRSLLHSGLRSFSLMQHIQRAAYWIVAPQSLQLYFDAFSAGTYGNDISIVLMREYSPL
jgi:hypothetical protein